MATALQDLVDKRQAAWEQAQDFNTRKTNGDEMTAEDQAAWTRALDDVDRLGEEIANIERTASLDSRFAEIDEQQRAAAAAAGTPDATGPSGGDAEYRSAFQSWMRRGATGVSAEEQATLQRGFSAFENGDPELRALGAATGSAGGYTVPEGFWAKVTETLKYYGGAEDGAEVITTTIGNPLPWPTNNDTSNTGYMLGEGSAASNEGDLTFGQKSLGAYTFVSGPAQVSLILSQDSAFDIESFVARKMGERIGRAENPKFTTGTGSSQPQGYITGATLGKTAASTTAVTYNEIVDLEHSVDRAYRANPNDCLFKFHDLVFAELRKLRDDSGGAGVGRPLWQPSVTAGAPDTFNGYRYAINNDMASSLGASNKTIAFGNFRAAFVVRRVVGGQLMRLTERYAEYLQVGFIGYERADSLVQDAAAVKYLAQAAS